MSGAHQLFRVVAEYHVKNDEWNLAFAGHLFYLVPAAIKRTDDWDLCLSLSQAKLSRKWATDVGLINSSGTKGILNFKLVKHAGLPAIAAGGQDKDGKKICFVAANDNSSEEHTVYRADTHLAWDEYLTERFDAKELGAQNLGRVRISVQTRRPEGVGCGTAHRLVKGSNSAESLTWVLED